MPAPAASASPDALRAAPAENFKLHCPSCNFAFGRKDLPGRSASRNELYTQAELMRICATASISKCLGMPTATRIDAYRIPPMFFDPGHFASSKLHCRAGLKGKPKRGVKRRLAQQEAPAGGSSPPSVDVGAEEGLSTQRSREVKKALLPLADAIYSGELDPIRFAKDHEKWSDVKLGALLRRCGHTKVLSSRAQQVAWVQGAIAKLQGGESECHSFVQALKATGGSSAVSCHHGVTFAFQMLMSAESLSDHTDLMRSCKSWPMMLIIDDACGMSTYLRGNYPSEAAQLLGDNRGCFRTWVTRDHKDFPERACQLCELPEFTHESTRALARTRECQDTARRIFAAKGELRCGEHPFLPNHRFRLILCDRFHQGQGSKSHKRPECSQHRMNLCTSLNDVNSSMAESLNARKNRRLKTLCTVDIVHYIPLLFKFIRWDNEKIIATQTHHMKKSLQDGEMMIQCPLFGWTEIVCAKCKKPDHVAAQCQRAECE